MPRRRADLYSSTAAAHCSSPLPADCPLPAQESHVFYLFLMVFTRDWRGLGQVAGPSHRPFSTCWKSHGRAAAQASNPKSFNRWIENGQYAPNHHCPGWSPFQDTPACVFRPG